MRMETAASLTETVYRTLRADLLSCRIQPGERLRIALLSSHHGASAGAVREALSKLTAEGLVTAEPQRGFQAATISAEELTDLTSARVEIECLCLRKAIEDGDLGWEERLLGSSHRLLRTPIRVNDDPARVSEDWALAHEAFHEALVAACRSRTLLQVRRQLYAQSERYRRLAGPLAEAERDLDGEHRALTAAALERDPDRAVRAMKQHLEETTRILLMAGSGLAALVA